MSIEIWQFPRSGSQRDLVASLRGLGFVVARNVFWPGPPGTVSLFWADASDYKSTSGVDASVFPLDTDGQAVWGSHHSWAVRTRTSIWASSFDKAFQNTTVRFLRKEFGGFFFNDHHGRNRYNVLASLKSTPVSRGLYAVLTAVNAELEALENALPPDMPPALVTPKGLITPENDANGVLKVITQAHPTRVLHNALVPFLVAALEYFFRESFEILLHYDPAALAAIEAQNRKVSFADVAAVARRDRSIESLVSDSYSFQNLDSIQKAFKDVLGIDVWSILRRRKKVRASLPLLSEALRNLITARHGVIHHLSLNRQLDQDEFLTLLHLAKTIIHTFAEAMERRLGLPFGPG